MVFEQQQEADWAGPLHQMHSGKIVTNSHDDNHHITVLIIIMYLFYSSRSQLPFAQWDREAISEWLCALGLEHCAQEGQGWIVSGAQLLSSSPHDLEKELGLKVSWNMFVLCLLCFMFVFLFNLLDLNFLTANFTFSESIAPKEIALGITGAN